MDTLEEIEAQLTGPGGPFETVEEPVLGEVMPVFKDRHSSLRDILEASAGHGDAEYIVCGDRHWQYISVDPKTGAKEFSCGPTSDRHASGFKEKNRSEMPKYLKIKGGFLSVTIDRENGKPFALFRHHDTRGGVYNEERIEAKE